MKSAGARFERADLALGKALWEQCDERQTEMGDRISRLRQDHDNAATTYLATIQRAIAAAKSDPSALERIFDHVGQGLRGSTADWQRVVNNLNELVITPVVRRNHQAQGEVAEQNTERSLRLDELFDLFERQPNSDEIAEVTQLIGQVATSGAHLALPHLRRAARSILDRSFRTARSFEAFENAEHPSLTNAGPGFSARPPIIHSENPAGAFGLSEVIWDAQSKLPSGDDPISNEGATQLLEELRALQAQATKAAAHVEGDRPNRSALRHLLSGVDSRIRRLERSLADAERVG